MNFDGNSQTLRLVTRLQIINDNYGLNLTYASLAAMIKYPQSSYIKNKKWSKHGYLFSEEKWYMIFGRKQAFLKDSDIPLPI